MYYVINGRPLIGVHVNADYLDIDVVVDVGVAELFIDLNFS